MQPGQNRQDYNISEGATVSARDIKRSDPNVGLSDNNNSGFLVILDASRNIRTFKLDKPRINIGRNDNMDIKINSKIVSGNHGTIIRKDDQFYYRDNGSMNGTYFNSRLIISSQRKASPVYSLGNGDILKIEAKDKNNPENTVMIFTTHEINENVWTYIDLHKFYPCLKIGRNVPEGHLKIDNMQVSKNHAAVYLNENGCMIQDTNSLNGVFVNNEKINGSCNLFNNDVISIGNTKIIYTGGYLIFNNKPNGVKLDIMDISRVVQGKKVILDHVTLTVNPCELVAIIGGSGAGKSTFMNCVNGFEPATSGQIIMDGLDLYSNYRVLKKRIGNVPQKDEVHDYLKVKDELLFTAKLRLTKDVSPSEIKKRVTDVLKIMDLYEHKETLIKKLSGGQRKRVSIAMELVSDPDIFFLDEPTSGLDPETETALMKQLKYLSSSIGKTILVITHTLQNIHLFDKIIFLAPGGKLCYYGSPERALDFFGVKALPDAYDKIKQNASYFIDKYKSMTAGYSAY